MMERIVLLFLVCVASNANAASHIRDCTNCVLEMLKLDPSLEERVGKKGLCEVCQNIMSWTEKAAQIRPFAFNSPWKEGGQQQYMNIFQKCQGRQCLNILPKDKRQPAVRKEYRALTHLERTKFHQALQKLKSGIIDGDTKYELFVRCHTPYFSKGAHGGPAFLPFHREFLKQFELALRQDYPDVALPYWDSSLDQGLPNASHSIIWTPEFMGNGNGHVVEGPFAHWITVGAPDGEVHDNTALKREVGWNTSPTNKSLYTPDDIEIFMSYNNYNELDICHKPLFEVVHNRVHKFVGGHMRKIPLSPSDPTFFLHHAFVDYLWEKFRQLKQNPKQRVTDYSFNRNCLTEYIDYHHPNHTMEPFSIKNIDGLSESYAELYVYDPSPKCAPDGNECVPASPYLFCDRRDSQRPRCLSKVRHGGNCTGFEKQAEDICYKSQCIEGKCAFLAKHERGWRAWRSG